MQPERRTDVLTACEIDKAIEIEREDGAIRAWIYLMKHGVPSATILRVLALSDALASHQPLTFRRRAFDRRR